MCRNLKYDLLMAQLIIIVLKYIISTIVNGKKHAIFCWTQIQRSGGGRHILVWPCIPAIRTAILIAKCMRIISLYLLASNGAQQRRRRRTVVGKDKKRTKSEKIYFKILRDIDHYEQLIVDAGNGIG